MWSTCVSPYVSAPWSPSIVPSLELRKERKLEGEPHKTEAVYSPIPSHLTPSLSQSIEEGQAEAHPDLHWGTGLGVRSLHSLPRPPKPSQALQDQSREGRGGGGSREERARGSRAGAAAPGTPFHKDRGGTSCSTEEIFPKVRVVVSYFKWPLFITVLLGSLSWQMMIKDSREGARGLFPAGLTAVGGGSARGRADSNTWAR